MVADDVPVGVALAVRPHVDDGAHLAPDLDEPQCDEVVERQLAAYRLDGDLLAEHEQPGQQRVGAVLRLERAARRHGLVAGQCRVRRGAEQREQPVGGEAGIEEGAPDALGRVAVDLGGVVGHGPIIAQRGGDDAGPGGMSLQGLRATC